MGGLLNQVQQDHMDLRFILGELVAFSVRTGIVDALLLSRIQLVESGVGSHVNSAVESLGAVLFVLRAFLFVLRAFFFVLRAYQFQVPCELIEGNLPLGGLSLLAFTLVLHEDHFLWDAIPDVANGPVDALLGDLWKGTRFRLDTVVHFLLKVVRQEIELEDVDSVLRGIRALDLVVIVQLNGAVQVLVTVSGR